MSIKSFILGKTKTLQADVTVTGAVLNAGHLQITGTHAFEVGDIVSISGIVGAVEANVVGIVSSIATTVSFKLENTPCAVTAYTSGGTVKHIGWATPLVLVDATTFPTVPDMTFKARIERLDASCNARVTLVDSADAGFLTSWPLAHFNSFGGIDKGLSQDKNFDAKMYEMPGIRAGVSGDNCRVLFYMDGGAGKVAQFGAWLEY